MNTADRNRSARLNDVLRDVFKGDREQLIERSKRTKGRISQLLTGDGPFGERAARTLELKLGLRPGYLDEATGGQAVSDGSAKYGSVRQKIIAEQSQGDPYEMIHKALKALRIYDETEKEILTMVRKEADKADALWRHFTAGTPARDKEIR